MDTTSELMQREILKTNPQHSRNETTIQEIIDAGKVLSKYLDEMLYSSQEIQIEVPEEIEEENIITGKIEKTIKKKKIPYLKKLPSEEKIFGCRELGIDCKYITFRPDSTEVYSVNSEIFNGYCVIFSERDKEEAIKIKIDNILKHIKDKHKIDLTEDEIRYNLRWLKWAAITNMRGYSMVKDSIMAHVSPLISTSIIPENSSRNPLSQNQALDINAQAVDDASSIMQDLIVRHRYYGFDNDPTTIIRLMRFMHKIFYLSLSRSINGITIRGVINSVEERRVAISNENTRQEEGSVFNRVIKR